MGQSPILRASVVVALTVRAFSPCLAGSVSAQGKPPRVIANAYPSLQAAVDALPGRMGEVYLPPGNYVLEKTLDLSSKPGGYPGGIRIVGAGRSTRIIPKTKGQPAIDLTGTNHCLMESLWITAENVTDAERPNVGLLLARNANGQAALAVFDGTQWQYMN